MTSSTCSVCGSIRTEIIDGLMYCAVCGTQIFDYRELEADDDRVVIGRAKIAKRKDAVQRSRDEGNLESAMLGLSTTSVRKRRKGEELQCYLESSAIKDSKDSSEILKDITTGQSHAPSYLKSVGRRLCTFTKMLAKGVAAIRRETAIPNYTDDLEEMFRALVVNKDSASESAKEKKKKKERRKERGQEALEKSTTAWDLLMSDTVGENLDIQSDSAQEDEFDLDKASTARTQTKSNLVQVVDTMVPKKILNSATSFYLALDVLAALLFISLITAGCRWILLSDIIRYLGFCLLSRVRSSLQNIPLYEFHRTVLFIWQICRLPSTPVKVDFEQGPFANGFLTDSKLRFSASQMVTVFGRPLRGGNRLNTDIFFSTETKAFAYILMALKLCFGLDGVREFDVHGNADSLSNNTFNVIQWLYQLKMRIMFWEGYDPLDILQAHRPVEPLLYERDFKRGHVSLLLSQKHVLFPDTSSSNGSKAKLEQIEIATGGNRIDGWYSYFPCAKGYERYPRPNFTNGGFVHMREKDRFLLSFNKKMGLGAKTSGLRMLFASRKAAIDAWECAQPAMSHTFSMLIHWFSKIIGESELVLYCAFMMLELQIVDFEKFNELRLAMVDGRMYPLKTTIACVDGRRLFKTLYVSSAEDVSDASEIDVVRIGVPRNWGAEADLDGDDESDDYSSNSSSELYSETADSDIGEVMPAENLTVYRLPLPESLLPMCIHLLTYEKLPGISGM
uniref:TATA box-binding protein-associated factor RNA polymerase I subunit B n=1 Tax=Angiostrongylus cantonensis TaxID=6313 RepID=A0A158P5W1_ANGCA